MSHYEDFERPPQYDLHWYVNDARFSLENLVRDYGDFLGTREELTYWNANYITHWSLYDLVIVNRQLGERVGDDWSANAKAGLEELLPFDRDELADLDRSIVRDPKDDSDSWYQNAEPKVVLYIDRWRRWLDVAFDEEGLDDPTGNAAQTLNLLRHIEFKLP